MKAAPPTPARPRAALSCEPLTVPLRPAWDRYVAGHPHGTFFHGIVWMESVLDAFGHRPHYLLARRDEQIVGVLPLFEVRSRFAGSMLVSVPYAVGGGILADDDDARTVVYRQAREVAEALGSSRLEFRSAHAAVPDLPVIERYVGFRRELPLEADDLPGWLPRKARAAARNATRKHGLAAAFGAHHLPTVWRLYARSMRRLGSLAYPYRFLDNLIAGSGEDAHVQVVMQDTRVIAGLVSFRFGDTFLPYFAGWDERFRACSTNNFLYLAAMRRAIETGCRVFDFGRTRIDNRGSFDFKRFHGFEPKALAYQAWTARDAHVDLTPSNPRFRIARRVWRHLPLALSNRLSLWAAQHVPG